MSKLDRLKKLTTIVVDTGDIETIKEFSPTDATTNPSLIFQAVQKEQYQHLVEDAVEYSLSHAGQPHDQHIVMMERLFVNFGIEILKIIPGRVSTEVDARLSFDIQGSIQKAHRFIQLYEELGISKDRVLIKLASTWEGSEAARVLEKEGIHCNMTLMFSLPQAVKCAEVRATLISPFVGRILDWYKKAKGVEEFTPEEDPGVLSVTQIYNYFKKFGYKTQIMGASFRNADQITELAGCDLLTISPKFLKELSQAEGEVPKKLDSEKAKKSDIERIDVDEPTFRLLLNNDAMATEKLAEGIRVFAQDAEKLEKYVIDKFHPAPR